MGAILPDATLEGLARALALSLPGTDRVSVSVLGVLATGCLLYTSPSPRD